MKDDFIKGLDFLIRDIDYNLIFTPNDFSEEHRMIGQMVEDFVRKDILANSKRIESLDLELTKELLRKSADIGLLGLEIPEEYGGVGLDKVSAMIIAEKLAILPSFAASYGGHSGLGTLPIVYFGNEYQKRKYLPKFASGELFAAYALTEAEAGSDATAAKTNAILSPDGKYYILNGEKMWITNAGFADVFIVFAKIDGEKFTAFIVERDYEGFKIGAEEKKMGLKGSSTRALSFENVKVPIENLLGEIGKGLKIALNILNIGRLKIGAGCVGSSKEVINEAIKYSNERKQFGRLISSFGAIKEKIARMIINTYVGESMIYRTAGLLDEYLHQCFSPDEIMKRISEYATECAICKVLCSEFLDYTVDEAVQIFGGYGYSQEYCVERHYRDSRVNRIFEGTNEINRLVICSMLLKKLSQYEKEVKSIVDSINSDNISDKETSLLKEEKDIISSSKKLFLLVLMKALEKIGDKVINEQEIAFRISDIVIQIYAMDSLVLRILKERVSKENNMLLFDIAKLFCFFSSWKIRQNLIEILQFLYNNEELSNYINLINKGLQYYNFNAINCVRNIAENAISENKYNL